MLPRDIWVHHPDALQRQARACGGVRAGPSGGAPPPWAQQPGCRRRPTVTCLRMPVPWCVPLRASTAGPHPPCCPCCPPPPPLPQVLDQWRVRVVSWIGDWVCPCERTHFMRINCPDCGYSAPCRWVLQQGSYLPGGGGGGGGQLARVPAAHAAAIPCRAGQCKCGVAAGCRRWQTACWCFHLLSTSSSASHHACRYTPRLALPLPVHHRTAIGCGATASRPPASPAATPTRPLRCQLASRPPRTRAL